MDDFAVTGTASQPEQTGDSRPGLAHAAGLELILRPDGSGFFPIISRPCVLRMGWTAIDLPALHSTSVVLSEDRFTGSLLRLRNLYRTEALAGHEAETTTAYLHMGWALDDPSWRHRDATWQPLDILRHGAGFPRPRLGVT